uniref:Uncharacterized protein n=1 Tax=Rhizophora mucronata TaxID=61149 RepID=A0A2P2IYX0_RHIMU
MGFSYETINLAPLPLVEDVFTHFLKAKTISPFYDSTRSKSN